MKRIVEYKLGDEIPEAAKFIHAWEDTFYYEMKESKKSPQYTSEEIHLFGRVITYLNRKLGLEAGTGYKPTSKETRKLIKTRLNQGAKPEDFQKVIDSRMAAWANDEKMHEYLRPSTLFGPKFNEYLHSGGVEIANNPFDKLDEIAKMKEVLDE